MPTYTIAALAVIPCPDCGVLMKSHCTAHDGAWVFHPCAESLKATGLAPVDWWEQVAANGDCLHCSMKAASHFTRPAPGIAIKFGYSVPQRGGGKERYAGSITPKDTVSVKAPTAFRDCRPVP